MSDRQLSAARITLTLMPHALNALGLSVAAHDPERRRRQSQAVEEPLHEEYLRAPFAALA